MKRVAVFMLALGVSSLAVAQQQLPPPPVPSENPITEPKRLLGKILFWDEQVGFDNTVACGTCHSPARAGADGRIDINPGPDTTFATVDDIFGSTGVVRTGSDFQPKVDPVFGLGRQVTSRAANVAVSAAYAPLLFWDGRAGSMFLNPETGGTSIVAGGALENQAMGPILSAVEMGHEGRSWPEVTHKLAVTEPLGHATRIPADLAPAMAAHKTYPQLFQDAYGDSAITAERIAYAIATYERTLIPNQTPWDQFVAGNQNALTPPQQAGWNFFRNSPCAICHAPPFFTDQSFRNIGVRPVSDDTGRQAITNAFGDRGRFKVPTLRNVGLKATFMHNGRFNSIQTVIAHYRPNNPARSPENLDPILPVAVPGNVGPQLDDFLRNGLRDPRVAAETFPFDRPALHAGAMPQLSVDPDRVTLRWPALQGVASYVVYRGRLSDLVDADHDGLPDGGYGVCIDDLDPNTTDTTLVDVSTPSAGEGFFYLKGIVDGGTIRGLGVTSAGLLRQPAISCP